MTPAAARSGRLRRPWVIGLALALALGAGAGYWFFLRPEPHRPPEIELTGTDPEIAEAITSAREQVLREPQSAEAWGRLGMVLRAHDNGAQANECFAVAEELDPTEPRWPYLQGLTLLLTDPDAGIDCLRRAVARANSTPGPRLRLAEALLARGELDEAEEQFRTLLERYPGYPRALVGLGRLQYERGDLRESATTLRQARESPLVRKEASQLLAKVAYRLDDHKTLKELGDVAGLPEDPPWSDPIVGEVESLRVGKKADLERAEFLLTHGQGREAVEVLEQLTTRRPEDAEGWLALGRTLVQLQSYSQARQALREAVRLDPDSVEGWFKLGVAEHGRGDPGAATECFRKVVALKPDHVFAQYNLGQCLKDRGDRAGAREAFRAALRARPGYRKAEEQLRALETSGPGTGSSPKPETQM
jgi:tetratricopeptide (TPR) repeat protein